MEIQLNLNKICRLCLEEKYEHLEDVFGNESNLCENILRATTVKIQQGDGLPAHVCQQCVSLVNVIINFQRKCVVTDLALHHYIRKCICHKEHKECEAVKLHPRDPLQLTQVVKTEGGPCQIKSETSVFQLQETREEVITGIIEEGSSNPKVNVKPELSESSIRTTKSIKGKCISVNVNHGQSAAVKVHKRRRRKGHRWQVKKQSSVNRKRALDVHLQHAVSLQSTETFVAEPSIQNQKVLQNSNSFPASRTEESSQNRISPDGISLMAAEEGLPNTTSSITMTVNKKVKKSGNSSSIVVNKKMSLKEAVHKRTVSSCSDIDKMNKNPTKDNLQNKRAAKKKAVEENPQNKRTSHNSKTIDVNKKTASKESQENTRASETSKMFLGNKKSLVEDATSYQMVTQSNSVLAIQNLAPKEHVQVQKRKSFSRKPVIDDGNSTANQKPEMEAHRQIQRVSSPTRNFLRKKLASEEAQLKQIMQQSCSSAQANHKLQMQEHVQFQTRKSSSKKTASTSNQKLPKNSKSIPANQIQMRTSLLEKQVTLDPTPSINSLVNNKLVAEPCLQIQKMSPSSNCFINKPFTGDTLNQNAPQSGNSISASQKLQEKEVQTQKVSLKGRVLRKKSFPDECPQKGTSPKVNCFPTNKTPGTVQNGAFLSRSETFQTEKLVAEQNSGQQNSGTSPANEKHLQIMSDNSVLTKRKTLETESSVPEALSTKKQKSQENDRLTKLVIQVEGNKLCCSQCDSWFEDIEELKRHLEELHNKRVVRWHTVTGPGPEKDVPPSLLCATCGKQFTSQRLFSAHQNQKWCW